MNIANLGASTEKFSFVVAFGASSTLSSVTLGNVSVKEFLNMIKKETIVAHEEKAREESTVNNEDSVLDGVIESNSKAENTHSKDKELNINGLTSLSKFNINSTEGTKVRDSQNHQLQEFILRVNTLMGQAEAFENEEDVNPDDEANLKQAKTKKKKEASVTGVTGLAIENKKSSCIGINNLHDVDEEETENMFDITSNTVLKYAIDSLNSNPPDDWDALSKYKFNAMCHSFSIPKDRNNSYIDWKSPMINHSSIRTEVSIKDQPFAEGAMRYAFYMKDLMLQQNLVGKLDKKMRVKENTLSHYSKDILSIVFCRHIAYDFNDRVINIVPDTRLLINFVHAYIYEMIDYCEGEFKERQLNSHQRFFSVENYIQGDYNKYNNNAGWINDNLNESAMLAQAFSHFSWQITKGYMMIVDLQGVDNILTDPQIHCLDNKRFGKGNLGYVGIMKFFMSHICNEYCKHLNLVHPRKFLNIDKEYDFFVDKYVPPEDPENTIFKLCDICKNVFKIKAKDLYDKKKKCWDAFCGDCETKRKETFTFGRCKLCKGSFKSSAYLYMMKREPFPDACQKCKVDQRVEERKEFNEQKEDSEDDQIHI
eukprot:CAMPEP_0170526782 /NCGR_PEP_ID=MMETSP0209-20121228/12182_1 /TAXON_ID=665100 ORGANISM="Litonotus pictus, Strain P1" /NCGR_SAMPLE_ID=MMETSP0209 /ASSEMBLY_ACC=CAM_ASM_000301 /LENGTH=594 /DNA_ID=CAMNT_0010816815 /DNA_START=1 /DNA_END=1785 /DNA_ORIENTATION=+